MPCCFPLEAVFVVGEDGGSGGRSWVGGGKTSEWKYFVDECCLCEGDVSLWCCSEIYSEEGVDVWFFCEMEGSLEGWKDVIERRLVFSDEKGVVDVDKNNNVIAVE